MYIIYLFIGLFQSPILLDFPLYILHIQCLNQGEHQEALKTTTPKPPIMHPLKSHASLRRPSSLPKKTVTHLGESYTLIKVSGTQKIKEDTSGVGQQS